MFSKKGRVFARPFLFIEKEIGMSYKYSKGSTVQGDIKAADDAERNTVIDFGEDQIEFQTSGSTRLKIENHVITTTTTLHISGSDGEYGNPYPSEALVIGKRDDRYAEIQFENDGQDMAYIQLNSGEGFAIGCQSSQDDILFFTNDGSDTEAMRITHDNRLGINTNSPDYTLDVAGDIGVDQKIYHNGDPNTYINFTDDNVKFNIGGKLMFEIDENSSAPHEITINGGGNNTDFIVKGNSNNPGMKFIGASNRLGINGVGEPSCALDIDSNSIRLRDDKTPSSASDTGDQGQICWDSDYLYICVASNTWKRIALSSW